MTIDDNQDIRTPELPGLEILREVIDNLRSLSYKKNVRDLITKYYESRSPYLSRRIKKKDQRFVLHLEEFRDAYLKLMRPDIEKEVYSVIGCLSDFYKLDGRFGNLLPDIWLVDFMGLGREFVTAQIDAMDGGSGYPTYTSYFQEPIRLNGFYPNPSIHLNVRDGFPLEDIVEESLHFLQWFYSKDEFGHMLGCMYLNDKKFLGLTQEKGSQIIIPNFEIKDPKLSIDEYFSEHISDEALAFFTRVKFGLTIPKTYYELSQTDKKVKIPGIPNGKSPLELLDTLTEHGRETCYSTMCNWNNVKSLDGIGKKLYDEHVLSYRFMDFPQGLVHYLAYGLGERLAVDVQNPRDIEYFGKTFFQPSDPNKRLDHLVSIHLALSP